MALKDYSFAYTPVKDKAAFVPRWQTNPYRLDEVRTMIATGEAPGGIKPNGFGLMTGMFSGGIAALDIDGPEAFDFIIEQFGLDILKSANFAWTSGRQERMQIGWQIPEQYWDVIDTISVGVGNKLNFRWDRLQSVMPPSVHPTNESGRYDWVIEPNGEPIAEMPSKMLEFWISHCESKMVSDSDDEPMVINDADWFMKKVSAIVEIIRNNDGIPGYDGDLGWRAIGHAVASAVGVEEAKSIMMQFYPEQKRGEYKKLYSSYNSSESPKFGRLCKRAIEIDSEKVKEINRAAYQAIKRKMSAKERMKFKLMKLQENASRYANFRKWGN